MKSHNTKPASTPKIGTQAWVDSHYDTHGILHVSKRELNLMKQTPEWREGFRRFSMVAIIMANKMNQRSKEFKKRG